MTQSISSTRPQPGQQVSSSAQSVRNRLPSGYRIVHVSVPEPIFNHAKAQAYLSGLRFPEYVANVLRDGKPYLGHRPPAASVVPLTPGEVQP